MIRMMSVFLLVLILNLQINSAYADCDEPPSGETLLEKADLIFEGDAVSTHRIFSSYFLSQKYNYKTRFKIIDGYKGENRKYVDIFYKFNEGSAPTIRPVEKNDSYLVFAQKDSESDKYYFSTCFTNKIPLDAVYASNMNTKVTDSILALVEAYPDMKDKELKERAYKLKSDLERRKAKRIRLEEND